MFLAFAVRRCVLSRLRRTGFAGASAEPAALHLFAIGGSSASDVYSKPRTSVDLGTSYAFDNNLSVYFNAKNLSTTKLEFTEGTSNHPIQREYYGVTLQAGLNFNY